MKIILTMQAFKLHSVAESIPLARISTTPRRNGVKLGPGGVVSNNARTRLHHLSRYANLVQNSDHPQWKPVRMTTQLKDYVQNIPEKRMLRFKSISALILELYPDSDVSFKYNMPTYEWHGGWVALANQKHYISLYTCGAEHLREFKRRHPKIKTGKGCINFRDRDEIPLADLVGVIHSSMTSHTN